MGEIMFCSARCRNAWEAGMQMIPTPTEEAAIKASLGAVGAYVGQIGMDKPLQDYSKDEALGLVRAAVCEFRKQLTMIEDLNDEIPF